MDLTTIELYPLAFITFLNTAYFECKVFISYQFLNETLLTKTVLFMGLSKEEIHDALLPLQARELPGHPIILCEWFHPNSLHLSSLKAL